MKCTDCKYAVLEDNGYSNWTVMGTDFSCAKRKHPSGSFDMYYGEAKDLEFAETCPSFEHGEPVRMDVDGEDFEEFSDEHRLIWLLHQGQPS